MITKKLAGEKMHIDNVFGFTVCVAFEQSKMIRHKHAVRITSERISAPKRRHWK